jgi:hypothetical protein
MSPDKFRAAFLAAGGNLLLRDLAWLQRHQAAGRTPAATAALTRIVMGHQLDAFIEAVRLDERTRMATHPVDALYAALDARGDRPRPRRRAADEQRGLFEEMK